MTFEGPPTEADIQPQVQMLVNDTGEESRGHLPRGARHELGHGSAQPGHADGTSRSSGSTPACPNAPKGAIYATAATNSYAAAGLAADKMFPAIKDKIAAATRREPGDDRRLQPGRHQPVGDGPRQGLPRRDDQAHRRPRATTPRATSRWSGNPAYIAPDSPTSGKAIIIDVRGPCLAEDHRRHQHGPGNPQPRQSDHILGIFCSNEGTVDGASRGLQ